MRALSSLDNYQPRLPVEEQDGVFLETTWVRLNDIERNEQVLDAVQTARNDLPSVRKPKKNEIEDVASPDYGTTGDGLDEKTDDNAVEDELRLCLERIRRGSFDELEAILSVYATRATYWQAVVWRGGAEEQKLRQTGAAASALSGALDDLYVLGFPLRQWLTEDEEKQLKKALTALKPLQQTTGLSKKEGPDLVGELAMMLILWWRSTTGNDPGFWTKAGRQEDPKGSAQFMRFLRTMVLYLPPELRPTVSKGTPGLGEQALRKRLTKSAKARDSELKFFSRLSKIMEATLNDPNRSAAYKRFAGGQTGALPENRPKVEKDDVER